MTRPELPSLEARFFGAPWVWWLEHVDGVWRAWTHDGMYSGVWEDPEDRFREYTITAEVDGRLPWRQALEAIAAILWAPVDNPRPYENEQRSSERRRFPDTLSEDEWLEYKTFPVFPHLRVANDVAALRGYIFCDEPNLDALDAIETLAYLAIEGSEEAEQVLLECLGHPHYRVRCECVEALAFVRWRQSGHGQGYRTLDQALWVPRMPVNYNPPSIGPGLPFADIATKALADEDPNVRCVGLRYLRLSNPAGVVDNTSLRTSATSDPSSLVRRYALRTLNRVRDPEAHELAIELSRDVDEDVSDWALMYLRMSKSPKALTAILRAARRDDKTRLTYIWQALKDHLQRSRSRNVRNRVEATALSLGREPRWRASGYLPALLEHLGTEASLALLAELEADPDPAVQEARRIWAEHKAEASRYAEEHPEPADDDEDDEDQYA